MDKFLRENYDSMSDRELARELEISEKKVKIWRKELGLIKLDSLLPDQESSLSIDIEFDEMDRRRLQGFFGEKISRLIENRVVGFLEDQIASSWMLRRRSEIVQKNDISRNFYIGRRPQRGETLISGSRIKHWGHTEEELQEIVEERCVALEQDLFELFEEVRAPYTDRLFYGFEITGEIEKRFSCQDLEKPSFEQDSTVSATIPLAEDFKLMAVEVKTTRDDPKNLLSSNQRRLRDIAENSPHIDFYLLHVEVDGQDFKIPDRVKGKLELES